MSVFFVKGKGWRYEFEINKIQYSKAWFKTKTEARNASEKHREEIKNPKPVIQVLTDMVFGALVESRLDYIKAYSSERHYKDYVYMARRWIRDWGTMPCSQITQNMIQQFIYERSKVSHDTANKEIRYLRATFNFGKKQKFILENPIDGIDFLPVEKKTKYIPPKEDVLKVILAAGPHIQDYLYAIKDTLARMSEINRLTWEDIDFENKAITVYTRKKKGGHLTPRQIPMTNRIYEILSRRNKHRDKTKPWVFWHTYWSSKTGEKKEGPFTDRKRIMKTLCKKAGVKYFRFHALRHYGASIMDNNNVPIGSIQKILGHEKRSTTEIYLHNIGNAEREAMDIFEKESETGISGKIKNPSQNPSQNK